MRRAGATLAARLHRAATPGGRSAGTARALGTAAAAAASPQSPGGYFGTGMPVAGGSSSGGQRVLVTGAAGQIGGELTAHLRERYGADNVVASDVRMPGKGRDGGHFVYCDVQDYDSLARVILENGIDSVVHLASLLSAVGERNPQLALKINTAGIQHVLELARLHSLRVYSPSTIAVFGESTPKVSTPEDTIMQPTTMYGVTVREQRMARARLCRRGAPTRPTMKRSRSRPADAKMRPAATTALANTCACRRCTSSCSATTTTGRSAWTSARCATRASSHPRRRPAAAPQTMRWTSSTRA